MTNQKKIDKIKEFINYLELPYLKPLSEKEIKEKEKSLGVEYPEQYREFLRMYGWLALGEDHLGGREGVKEALRLQENHPKGFPKNLIPLDDNGSGDYYCLVCGGEDHGKVIFWQHDAPDDEVYPNIPQGESKDFWVEAPDFWTWLLDRLELQRQIREEF